MNLKKDEKAGIDTSKIQETTQYADQSMLYPINIRKLKSAFQR